MISPPPDVLLEAVSLTEILERTSGLVTVHLSSRSGVPVAGGETTSPVAGSTIVTGMGSFSGWPSWPVICLRPV